ncbi:ComF family protein [Patescibacteria group bacterium]|nr:ComF family protein [Patescibacteria group bacterium]
MLFKSFYQNIFNKILNIFFPVECFGCNKEDTYFCQNCFAKIPLHHLSHKNLDLKPEINKVLTATDYRNPLVEKIIQGLKFRYIIELAEPLAELLIKFYQQLPEKLAEPLIIPVPLHKKRTLERSFNQAELIAKIFADHFKYPLVTKAVKRAKNTPHQVGLNKKQRMVNIKNAFTISQPKLIQQKNIIIVDDVLTTGATLKSLAKTLKDYEAKNIWALTIAQD